MASHFVRPYRQVYQVEREKNRIHFVRYLGKFHSKQVSETIAQLAIFDLSSQVRAAAREELASRRPSEFRHVFLQGLRYPWAPAANHAAVALVELNDDAALPELNKLVDLPDPSEPFAGKGGLYVRELVRINHLKNCLLCHPPAASRINSIPAPIPVRGEKLPVVYYAGRLASNSIDASTVYLRQDLSVLHKVAKPEKWPEIQRFDYLVRTRPYQNTRKPTASGKARQISYPQRDAVLYALNSLQTPPEEPGAAAE